MAGEFTIDGTTFRGINGGPVHAHFTEAVSFSISCRDQSEVDYFWHSLADGGEELGSAFLGEYLLRSGSSDPDVLLARVAAYRTVALARLAVRSWCRFKPQRLQPTLDLLDEPQRIHVP